MARRFKAVYSRYQRGKDLIQIGAYAPGSDRGLDEAIALNDSMVEFLQQDMLEASPMDDAVGRLQAVLGTN